MQAITPQIWIHMVAAFGSLAIGIFILTRKKGDTTHKRAGWAYVALMLVAAISSIWIPSFGKFSWIHLFTVLTLVSLPWAIYNIRKGNVDAHRSTMIGLFTGGLVIAGLFTLVPGRILGNALWGLLR